MINNYPIEELYNLACNDILCNTSYPINPKYFSCYKSTEDIMNGSDKLSFYFHIPFCKSLCKFCEYTRFLSEGSICEDEYIKKLKQQFYDYISVHNVNLLYGLDIGGGTPSSLDIRIFSNLLNFVSNIIESYPLVKDFESSIEFSFSAIDEDKIKLISDHNINRMSAGIQIYDKELMDRNNRVSSSLKRMQDIVLIIRKYKVKKINIDIMYGFKDQTKTMLENTICVLKELHPDHITFYEMRYNVNGLKHITINRNMLFEQYKYLYEKVKEMGYKGRFGQNTFSLYDDEGISSYLRYRMYEGVPYKGFGVSAQSMSNIGISYNILKSVNSKVLPQFDKIIEQDVYLLPKDEIMAKYVCISLYSGRFRIDVLNNILKDDAYAFYKKEFDFLEEMELVKIKDKVCELTAEGFKNYGAVASLFWSNYHKQQYMSNLK